MHSIQLLSIRILVPVLKWTPFWPILTNLWWFSMKIGWEIPWLHETDNEEWLVTCPISLYLCLSRRVNCAIIIQHKKQMLIRLRRVPNQNWQRRPKNQWNSMQIRRIAATWRDERNPITTKIRQNLIEWKHLKRRVVGSISSGLLGNAAIAPALWPLTFD